MTWVSDRIFAAGGTHIPRHWAEFLGQFGSTSVLHLNPGLPMQFFGRPPGKFLWLPLDHEEQADLDARRLAAVFICEVLAGGGQVLLHSGAGRHRTRWAFVAHLIWTGRSVDQATRLAAGSPWLAPYETELGTWERFAKVRDMVRANLIAGPRSEG